MATTRIVAPRWITKHGALVYFTTPGRVRTLDEAAATISTVAGNSTTWGFSGDGGSATDAVLGSNIEGIAFVGSSLLVADSSNRRIRSVTNGIITTVAGTGAYGYAGDGGTATAATLGYPTGIVAAPAGGYFVADAGNHTVRHVDAAGIIRTVVGTGLAGYSGDGGLATSAQLFGPAGLAVDRVGNLLIADAGNQRIRKVDAAGVITTIAGTGDEGGSGDGGQAIAATLSSPDGLAVDFAGNVLIADQGNHRIRAVTPTGSIVSVAGTGTAGYSGDGGPALTAEFHWPVGVAVDAVGDVYVGDMANDRIRKVHGPLGVPTSHYGTHPSQDCPTTVGTWTTNGLGNGTTATARIGVHEVDSDSTWVCVRIDGPSLAAGGKFVVEGATLSTPANPDVDEEAAACAAAGNTVPGPHPVLAGELGGPSDPTTHVPFMLDAFAASSGETFVCVRAGNVQRRVTLSTGAGVGSPEVTFEVDGPGPSASTPNASATPSGTCQTTTTATRFSDTEWNGWRVFLYGDAPSPAVRRLCVRAAGPASAGGVLTVDASAAGGTLPTWQVHTIDMTPCTEPVVQLTSPTVVRVRRSAPTFPASVCVTVGTDSLRVTVGPGSGGTPATVTWSPDPGTPGLP